MAGSLQFQPPTPLEYFASLVADDASLPLIEAAASIAQDEFPRLDTQGVLSELDSLAHKLRRRIPADAVPVQRLRWMNRYFFQESGFAGNANDYYEPNNSYLHRVLETRRGIPATLALVYVELATQIGLDARPVTLAADETDPSGHRHRSAARLRQFPARRQRTGRRASRRARRQRC